MPVVTSTVTGRSIVPSPARAADSVSRGSGLPRPALIASVPVLMKTRAAAMPFSSGPSAVRRTSTIRFFAPPFARSAACFRRSFDHTVSERDDAQIARRANQPARDERSGHLLADQRDLVRVGGVAANDRQRDLRARLAAQQPRALRTPTCRASACRRSRESYRRPQPAFLRGRPVARGDDVEVVAARQLDADVAIGRRLAAFDRASPVRG